MQGYLHRLERMLRVDLCIVEIVVVAVLRLAGWQKIGSICRRLFEGHLVHVGLDMPVVGIDSVLFLCAELG